MEVSIKKIAIIGTVGIPAKYGGFETLVEYLTLNLGNIVDFTVFCSAKQYSQKIEEYNNAKLRYINLYANGIQSILYDIFAILKSLKHHDSILILGVSGCIILPIIKFFTKVKIIVNIDGLEWKRAKWNYFIKKFLKFSEYLAVKYSDIVVCDNKVIKDYVFTEYKKNSSLIEYGADHVKKIELTNKSSKLYPFLNSNYYFKVCRIEPENNIHLILEAFSEVKEKELVIVGNWENSNYSKSLYSKYSNFNNITLLNPIYDQNSLNMLRANCYVYIHGHSAGGTNPSLVEAMFLELPIFAFKIGYNQETTKNKAYYFCDSSDLKKLLTNRDLDINKCKIDMKNIALENYTWSRISNEYFNLF